MNWKDKRNIKEVDFGSLNLGDVFVKDNVIYIVVDRNVGLDICNNVLDAFTPNVQVEKRQATLVLE